MLLLVVANLSLLVFIAGLAGWLVFPALLVCCVVDLLALYIFCTSVRENFDLENGKAEESKKAFEEENRSFIYLSALSSLWVSSVVGHQPQRIFLVSGIATLLTKLAVLAVVVALAESGHLTKIHPRPFLLFCFQENSTHLARLKREGEVVTCKFSEDTCFNHVIQTPRNQTLIADAISSVDEAIEKLERILNIERDDQTKSFLKHINKKTSRPEDSKLQQKVRICEEDETPIRLGLLAGIVVLTAIASYAIYWLHQIADYKVLKLQTILSTLS